MNVLSTCDVYTAEVDSLWEALGLRVLALKDWLLLLLVGGIAGPASAAESVKQPTPDYSPFVLRVDGHPVFDTISFKKVSQGHRASQVAFELMAQSLAMALEASHPRLLAEVVHAPEFVNPSNHRFCAQRHLYVDFWGLERGETWGYSLWAGCGHGDRFEWRNLSVKATDIAHQIERVTRDVSQRLKRADDRACYQRACAGS